MVKNIFLTGATGYIGKHLLAGLLNKGYRVHTLVRKKEGKLKERLHQLLQPFTQLTSSQIKEQLFVYEGDISLPRFGLKQNHLDYLKNNIDHFIHSAGMTCFDDIYANELHQNNFLSVCHAYELHQYLKSKAFHHISTAFVAGNHSGPFTSKDLDIGQSFKNAYEKSKFKAELFLKEKTKKATEPIIIYRPSIVIGGTVIGETQSATTLYTFLKALHFIKRCCLHDLKKTQKLHSQYEIQLTDNKVHIPLRVVMNPAISLNLIPIQTLAHVVLNQIEQKEIKSKTISVIASKEFKLSAIRDAFCRVLNLSGVALTSKEELANKIRSPLEQRFKRATKAYEAYLFSSPSLTLLNQEQSILRPFEQKTNLDTIALSYLNELNFFKQNKKRFSLHSSALDSLNINDSKKYLHHFANQDFGTSLLKRADFIQSKVLFRIKGDSTTEELLEFNLGHLKKLEIKNETSFDFGYEIEESVFQEMVHGKLNPREAFFQGKLKILGDQSQGLKLGFIFSEYFKQLDDRLIEELVEE